MNKAFTLIELLATISLLAIIALAITPIITNTLNTSKENLNKTQIEQIENAARTWGVTNAKVKAGKANPSFITIGELQKLGYLEDDAVRDMKDKSKINTNYKVCIKYQNKQFEYKYSGSQSCPS